MGGVTGVIAVLGLVALVASPPQPRAALLTTLVEVTLAFWGVHVALSLRRHRGDQLLLPAATFLTAVSWIEIARLSPALAVHQGWWILLSVCAMLAVSVTALDHRRLEDFKYVALGGAMLAQLTVMLVGTEVNGARLWLRFGGGFQAQPVELVKVLLIIFLAAYLHQNREALSLRFSGSEARLSLRFLAPLIVVAAVAEAVFVVQRDLGQGLLFFGVFLGMYFAATRRSGPSLIALLGFFALSWACWRLFGHVRVRVDNWLDPWRRAHDEGYQMVQAMYALASGGWFGDGVGRGQPWRVPEAATDFIFVSIVEEMGTFAAVSILAVLALLVARAMRAARESRDDFGALLACGLGFVLACQAFVIVAGTIRMIPMTGITLPFMSYGGSSLLMNFVMLGLLLQISHRSGAVTSAGETCDREAREGVRLLAIFAVGLLLTPALFLCAWQLASGDALARASSNPRTREDLRVRGRILDRRGEVLASTQAPSGTRALAPWREEAEESVRVTCAEEAFGPLIGYHSSRYGLAGLERALNGRLSGSAMPSSPVEALKAVVGRSLHGETARLTIDARVQRVAFAALRGRSGSVVALDPRNGAILALATSPSFDASNVDRDWARIAHDGRAPLLNRAVDGAYPPGSVIKPLLLAMALDHGSVTPSERFSCTGHLDVEGVRLHDAHDEVHGSIDVTRAIAESCNVTFAQIALRLGPEAFLEGLERIGLGRPPAGDLACPGGSLPARARVNPPMLAALGFGQGALLVTPLQVALSTAGIAMRGEVHAPRLVQVWESADGTGTETADTVWRSPFSSASAEAVARMMEGAVTHGTAVGVRLPGVAVAGKTGTAENPRGEPHAWMAAFAPVDAPRVVVVAIVENGGWGGEAAAPVARAVLEAALAIEAPGGESPVRPSPQRP